LHALLSVFGREPGGQPESISGITLLDARLLAIPARSLRGVWIYLTSPHLLRLFRVYLDSVGAGTSSKLIMSTLLTAFLTRRLGYNGGTRWSRRRIILWGANWCLTKPISPQRRGRRPRPL
jgi:CRISPR/Cas system CMR subunit Cmr4 (Cas7 group RAMP superfamily)